MLLVACALGSLVLAQTAAAADETAPAADPAAAQAADATDLQDLILLNAGRPIFVRLHIRLGDQGYQATWGDYLWERFQELDADASGMLDNDEFRNGDWTAFAERRTRTGTSRFEALTFLDLDTTPQDEGISFDELVEHLAQSCFGMSRGGQRRPAANGDPLFAILDRDTDKQLDATEMTAGLDSLYRFDRDEDEAYSDFELRADGNPFGEAYFEPANANNPTGELLLAPVPDQPPATICEAIIGRYDRAPAGGQPDRLLDRDELQLRDEQFVATDTDGNGKLDVPELVAWYVAQPPDVELEAVLDPDVKDRRVQVLSQPDAGTAQVRTELEKDGSIVIRGMSFELDLRGAGSAKPENIEKQTRQNFKRGDQDKNDYLDKQELRQVLRRGDFQRIDKDRDGKIFVEEYVEYVKHQNEVAAKRVNATFTDRGSTLFEILDTNRNNLLSLRELRALRQTASIWDRDGDGKIKHDDIPRRYQLLIAPGGPTMNQNNVVTFAQSVDPNQERPTGIGPPWFQRMDRNRDGDLTRREFLGTREQFQKLDADGDGLMDAKEAEKIAPAAK